MKRIYMVLAPGFAALSVIAASAHAAPPASFYLEALEEGGAKADDVTP